jgi:regulator of sigma E protease
MEFWIKAAQLFLSLAILVTLHELGHFIPAVLFKTRVEKFYLFFNPYFSLFRFKKVNGTWKTSWFSKKSPEEWEEDKNTTEWGLGWLPLGGYVKIAGMIDESMDKEQLEKPKEDWEFRSKKTWQRLIIMIGGVTVNLILGFIIYMAVLLVWGSEQVDTTKLSEGMSVHPYMNTYGIESGDRIIKVEGKEVNSINEINKEVLLRDAKNLTVLKKSGEVKEISLPEGIDMDLFHAGAMPMVSFRMYAAVVDEVVADSPAESAGLTKGDSILKVNNTTITYFDELQAELYRYKGKQVSLTVQRGKETKQLKSDVKEDGTLGFKMKNTRVANEKAYTIKDYSFGEGISQGFTYGANTLSDYMAQFKFIFTEKGASSVGGFASIGNMFPALWNWQAFWLNTALLSIILAFMNILPIPALDGGHVVFLLYEMITGKEAPQRVLEVAQYIGIALLLGLMIYANGNDIVKFFFK